MGRITLVGFRSQPTPVNSWLAFKILETWMRTRGEEIGFKGSGYWFHCFLAFALENY